MKWIKDFMDGDHIVGQLLVISCNKGTTDKGLSYLNITFQDKSGSIEAKKWDASDEDLRSRPKAGLWSRAGRRGS